MDSLTMSQLMLSKVKITQEMFTFQEIQMNGQREKPYRSVDLERERARLREKPCRVKNTYIHLERYRVLEIERSEREEIKMSEETSEYRRKSYSKVEEMEILQRVETEKQSINVKLSYSFPFN